MDPAVMLGQGLADGAGPVCEGAIADLAAVIGRWVTVTGKRRERGILITFLYASTAGLAVPYALARTRDSRPERACRLTAPGPRAC